VSVSAADICENKHGGNLESREAFERNKSAKQEQYQTIWDVMKANRNGLIVEEAKRLTNFPGSSSCAARISELKKLRLLIPKPDGKGGYVRRKTSTGVNAAVLVMNPNA
jgi:hypothetical protein